MDGGVLNNAWLQGTVHGQTNTGGIVGYADAGALINGAVNTAMHTVVGVSNTGGIAGSANNTSIANAMFSGVIRTSSGSSAGGIVGYSNSSALSNTLSIGSIILSNGTTLVGAVAGTNNGAANAALYDTRDYSTGVGLGSTAGTVGSNSNSFFGNAANYSNLGFSMGSTWTLTAGHYANLAFCGAGCTIALYSPQPTPIPVPTPGPVNPSVSTTLLNILSQTQSLIANPNAGDLIVYQSSDLMLIPGSALLGLTNLNNNSSAAWFVNNSYIIQGVNTSNVRMLTPGHRMEELSSSMDLVLQSLQNAQAHKAAQQNAIHSVMKGLKEAGLSEKAISSIDFAQSVTSAMNDETIKSITQALIDYFKNQKKDEEIAKE